MCFRPADASAPKNICKKCWSENDAEAEFCAECGAELPKMRPLPSAPGVPGPGAPKAPGAPAAPAAPAAPKAPQQ